MASWKSLRQLSTRRQFQVWLGLMLQYFYTHIGSAMCIHHKEKMEALYDFLLPYIRGNYAEQRTVTAVVFAECINHCKVFFSSGLRSYYLGKTRFIAKTN